MLRLTKATIVAIIVAVAAIAPAMERYVPEEYSTIQAALSAADDYDTIIVANGNYEVNLTNAKSVSLVAEGGAYLSAANSAQPIISTSVPMEVSGLKFMADDDWFYMESDRTVGIDCQGPAVTVSGTVFDQLASPIINGGEGSSFYETSFSHCEYAYQGSGAVNMSYCTVQADLRGQQAGVLVNNAGASVFDSVNFYWGYGGLTLNDADEAQVSFCIFDCQVGGGDPLTINGGTAVLDGNVINQSNSSEVSGPEAPITAALVMGANTTVTGDANTLNTQYGIRCSSPTTADASGLLNTIWGDLGELETDVPIGPQE